MSTIRLRRGTAAAWTTANPVLLSGEPGVATDTGVLKIGNGTDTWADLDAISDTSGSYAPLVHTHIASQITDFPEAVQDTVAAMLVSGANVTLTYNDTAGTLQVTAAGGDAEVMRDTIGAALVGTSGIGVAVNDAADTITFSITGLTISQTAGLQAALDALQASIEAVPASTRVSVDGVEVDTLNIDSDTPTKADVGLANVDNTSDANKPVSTAQQTALDLKADKTLTMVSFTDLTMDTTHAGKLLVCTKTTAAFLTIPANSAQPFPVGTTIQVVTSAVGQLTVGSSGGVTLLGGAYKSARQGSVIILIKIATDTWVVNGDVTT